MLSQPLPCPKNTNVNQTLHLKYSFILITCGPCGTFEYDQPLNIWTWIFCHKSCKGSKFHPNGLPQCGLSCDYGYPLFHKYCRHIKDFRENFCYQFLSSSSWSVHQAFACCNDFPRLLSQLENPCHFSHLRKMRLALFLENTKFWPISGWHKVREPTNWVHR